MATSFVQGRLRGEKLRVRIESSCRHCSLPIAIEVDDDLGILSPGAAQELQAGAIAAISGLARDLCEAIQAVPEDIVDLAVCGNTAMHHLLLGLPVSQLGRAPFIPAMCEAIDVKARGELGDSIGGLP